jgi:dTDP-4-dehydrorhamnose reductase
LITGVDGMLGANLACSLGGRCAAVGLFGRHPVSLPGVKTSHWDPADPAALAGRIRRERPQWIIHCGPLARGSWDLPHEAPRAKHEADTCALLAGLCREAGSRLTVLLTDAVFAGPRLFHDEQTAANSRQPFALAAQRVEKALAAAGALVVRTHAYGWSPAGAPPGFAEQVWQTLVQGKAAHVDPDRHATPILAGDLAELLWRAYGRRLQGLYHLAGAERTSAYRFSVELAAAFGLTSPAPAPEQDPLDGADTRHLHETSLNTRRARRELAGPMPTLREGLNRFAEQAANGYRARLRCGAPQAMAADAAA